MCKLTTVTNVLAASDRNPAQTEKESYWLSLLRNCNGPTLQLQVWLYLGVPMMSLSLCHAPLGLTFSVFIFFSSLFHIVTKMASGPLDFHFSYANDPSKNTVPLFREFHEKYRGGSGVNFSNLQRTSPN